MTLSAVVVDDEPLGRRGIVSRLRRSGAVEVVAECANAREAVEAVRRLRPDLLFLDVQMPGEDGFDVVAALEGGDLPHVVFVTAHDRYAVEAFRVRALDYLVKPIDDERFAAALSRAVRRVEEARESDLGRRMAAAFAEARRGASPAGPFARGRGRVELSWPVRSRGKITFVRHAEIDWVEAEGDYVRVHSGSRSFLVRETMAGAEKRLDSRRFLRIHRSTIVNAERIRELSSLENGDWSVTLHDGKTLRLSRTYRAALDRLTGRG